MVTEAAMLSAEARAFSKSKNHTKLSKTAIENRPCFFLTLNEFLHFEAFLTSEDGHRGCPVVCRGCHDGLEGQGKFDLIVEIIFYRSLNN